MALNLKLWLKNILEEFDEYRTYLILGFHGAYIIDEYQKNHPILANFARAYNTCEEALIKCYEPIKNWFSWFADNFLDGPRTLVLPTAKRRTYMDRDLIFLYASFQILVDFVELEIPGDAHSIFEESGIKHREGVRYPDIAVKFLREHIEMNNNESILFLYEWWTQVYLNRKTDVLDFISKKLADEISDRTVDIFYMNSVLNDWHNSEEEFMLELLLKVRRNLWI